MKTRLDISIPVSVFKEGTIYIAFSPVLDLSTSASSYALVKRRFDEVVELFFEELLDMGTVNDVLSNLGWVKTRTSWAPPIPVSHEMTNIGVPLSN
ncbi:MAG: hypothetical protein AAB960_00600 [Patescibacteria group bacterium]